MRKPLWIGRYPDGETHLPLIILLDSQEKPSQVFQLEFTTPTQLYNMIELDKLIRRWSLQVLRRIIMNKLLKSLVVLAVVAIAFGSATAVFAQSSTPQGAGPGVGFTNGRGAKGGGGMLGSNGTSPQSGLLHDAMIAFFAEEFDLSVEELNELIAEGETLGAIALEKGLTFDDFRALMVDARAVALDQAVANGDLTQEQADWLKTRGAGMGQANGSRGRGRGQGGFGTGECPYGNTTP
jgi:hypothetical protein